MAACEGPDPLPVGGFQAILSVFYCVPNLDASGVAEGVLPGFPQRAAPAYTAGQGRGYDSVACAENRERQERCQQSWEGRKGCGMLRDVSSSSFDGAPEWPQFDHLSS